MALTRMRTPSDLRHIDQAFPYGAASGPRYPEHMMSRVNDG